MNLVDQVIICSAGTGSRLGLGLPKCLTSVEGRPLIHWQLELLRDFEKVVIVVGFKAAQVIMAVREFRPGATFAMNHDFATTTTLDSMLLAADSLEGPFVYLDGDLLVTNEAIQDISSAPCPCIGIKRRYSEQPVCVTMRDGMVTGFTREPLEYEWTGLAKLDADRVGEARGNQYVYHAVEKVLPVTPIEIDCVEVDTPQDLEEARKWMKERTWSESSGLNAASA